MIPFIQSLSKTDFVPPIPDKTIVYSIDETLTGVGSFDYLFGGFIAKNPVNGRMVDYWSVRESHISGNAKIQGRYSLDDGETWSSLTDVIDNTPTLSHFNLAGGYDKTGRLHIISADANGNGTYHYISNDDGANFTQYQTIASPDVALNYFIVFQDIIEVNGILYAPGYALTDVGDFTESGVYCLKSTDNGETWNTFTIKAKSSEYVNESTIFHLGGSEFGCIARVEPVPGDYRFFRSSDNCETWSVSGADSDFSIISATHPPRAYRIFFERTTPVIALYLFDRITDRFYVCYATQTDILSNGTLAGTFANEIKQLDVFVGGANRSGYIPVCHYDQNLEGKWSGAYEVSIDEANRYHGTLPTDHYDTLKTSLGI